VQKTLGKNLGKVLITAAMLLAATLFSRAETILQKADSLYAAQRFSAAADLYRQSLFEERKISKADLLKLAFIEEGRDNEVMSIYYLHQLYLLQPLQQVKAKIEEMAGLSKLQGYSIDEADYAWFLYRRYAPWVEKGLFGMAFMLFCFLLYRKIKGVSLGYSPIFTLIFLSASAYFLNISLPYKRAIVGGEKMLLMSGPSSASTLLGTIDRGHRLEWIGQQDVWYEVKWNEKKGWVKKSGLLFFH
jgi:hypothetical protein